MTVLGAPLSLPSLSLESSIIQTMRADWPQYSAGPHLTGRKEIHSYYSYKSNTLFCKVFVRKVLYHLLFMHKRGLWGSPKVAKERKKLFYPLKKALSFMVIRVVHLLLQKGTLSSTYICYHYLT